MKTEEIKKEIAIAEWETNTEAYELLAKFLLKKFVIKKQEQEEK